jgi:hypothetical protein
MRGLRIDEAASQLQFVNRRVYSAVSPIVGGIMHETYKNNTTIGGLDSVSKYESQGHSFYSGGIGRDLQGSSDIVPKAAGSAWQAH